MPSLTLAPNLADHLVLFAPELVVCAAVLSLLLLRLFRPMARLNLLPAAATLAVVALGLTGYQWAAVWSGELRPNSFAAFSGLVQLDTFALLVRGFLLLFAVLALILARLGGIPDATDSADFAVLLLGGTLGMMLLASASHLLTLFIGLEMASLPCYALAGFLKGRKTGSEAALKYAVYGAAASGVALFGISLLVVAFGGGSYGTVAAGVRRLAEGGGWTAPAIAGMLLLFAGFAFKLSAVPFHFWLPDVFDGAAAEVGAFLAVASKGAAVAAVVRFAMTLQAGVGFGAVVDYSDPLFLPRTLGVGLLLLAGLTATVGNLAALPQASLKRLLGYSTVAHAGYMLLAVGVLTPGGVSAVLVYLIGYLPATLGAFAAVAAIRNATGGETIEHARGFAKRDPAAAVCLAIFLLSLLGIPPLAGFAGKFQAFAALYDAGTHRSAAGLSGYGVLCNVLLGGAVLLTAVSAGYYLRVLKAVFLDEPAIPLPADPKPAAGGLVMVLLAATVVAAGVAWTPVLDLTTRAAASFGVR